MPVKYALYPNRLTDNPDDHRAVVKHTKSYDVDDLIEAMISHGSTVTKAEALSVIEEYEAAILQFLAEGGRVNTALFQASLSVSGIFKESADRFDPKRHSVNLNLKPGRRARDLHKKITLKKVSGSTRQPAIESITDAGSDTVNDTLTPGGVGIISGRWLKSDPDNTKQGLFIKGSDGGEVRVKEYIRNMPGELIVRFPDELPTAPYYLELRTLIRHTNDIRTCRLNIPLH